MVKNQIETNLLLRTIRYAIERNRMNLELRSMSLTDDLTGIYNRRGFLTLAKQQLKIADRMKNRLLLLFIDLDGMKWINDNLGHREGDRALIDTANILRDTFRESDIIARLGGDEFTVLALEDPGSDNKIFIERLHHNIDMYNTNNNRPYKLAISAGMVYYNSDEPCTIDELLTQADSLMYEEKRKKKKSVA